MAGKSNPQTGGLEALVGMRRALLRASAIFGSLAVVVIMAIGGTGSDRGGLRVAGADVGIDDMMTGSIGNGERYVVSRSVLQAPGSAPCLYFPDGTRRGNC